MTTIAMVPPPPTNGRGTVVGRYERDDHGRLWLVKRRLKAGKHRMNSLRSWATDSEHLETLRNYGGYGVRLVEAGGTVWEATLADFDRHGFAIDFNHGLQTALPLKYWTKHSPGTRQLNMFEGWF